MNLTMNEKIMERLALGGAALLIAALLAVSAFAQSSAFRFFGPLSRIVTPNGDSRNDRVIFCFDNPADSDASGRVYSLLGSEVAPMAPRGSAPAGCPTGIFPSSAQALVWDGRSNGAAVHSGIYVYRITSELKTYTGTLFVVR